jgi:hypothetical protein
VRIITKELALKIVDKLGAQVTKTRKGHDLAIVSHAGKVIASFGIRRGSQRDQGHDHIQRSLHLSPNKARLLAQCPLSKDGWLDILKEKRLL